jgi:tetrahydromethanopterin S-methyltransferase subunit G
MSNVEQIELVWENYKNKFPQNIGRDFGVL